MKNSMKSDPCFCELRDVISTFFLKTRDDLRLTQVEFAEELNIDRRSYIDLEHNKNLCCAMTLLIFLCYHCKDVPAFLDECRRIFDKHLPHSRTSN